MSVVPMKLVTFTGPLSQFDTLVQTCVIDQQFHPERVLQIMRGTKGLRPFSMSNPYTPLLRRFEALSDQLAFPLHYAGFESDESLTTESAQSYLDDLEQQADQFHKRREALESKIQDAKVLEDQLENLKGISISLQELAGLKYVRFRYGYLPRETYDSFQDSIQARENIFFLPTDVGLSQVYGIYFTTQACRDQADSLFNSMHFTRITLDDRVQGTADEAFAALTEQVERTSKDLEKLQEELDAFRAQQTPRFLAFWSYLRYHSDVYDLRQYAARSRDNFYLMGWVPRSSSDSLCARAKTVPGVECVSDAADCLPHITPPTKLRNSFFASIFHPFLAMYGLPNYHELDPSLFLSITYTLFFGIMFGDIGQGLVLALVGLYLSKKKKFPLGHIITCCGLSGAIFGCIYGSVFGFEELLPGFKILHGSNVTILLGISLGLGVLMIALVMFMNILNGLKQKNWEKILFGPNGAAGMLFYLGLIIAVLSAALGGPNLFVPVYILPVLILPLVLILLREPLSKLLSGDPDWKHESWGTIVGLGFFELFETLLSYLTNTLSFLRVGAYAITHVGLMLVIQALAGANLNPVVLVLGNVFVICFEGLLVGIQVLRLEFYELFGRFYDDGGQAFKPKVVDYTAKSS